VDLTARKRLAMEQQQPAMIAASWKAEQSVAIECAASG